ncbi:16114_t:CDS:2, partial [Funneliformis geosporum]
IKIHIADIISTTGKEQIQEIWRLEYIIEKNTDIWQQSSISLCITSDQNQNNDDNLIYKFDYIKQIRGSEAYNPTLQEINSTQQKYGRAQGITRKAIDIAIATNSYDEFIGICHGFILDKQRNQELEIEIEDVANIKNPIITT